MERAINRIGIKGFLELVNIADVVRVHLGLYRFCVVPMYTVIYSVITWYFHRAGVL